MTITDDIRADEARKARALSRMLEVVTCGRGTAVPLREYLESAQRIPADEYCAAVDSLRETWTNTFQPPTPGHIREEAKRFSALSRSQIAEEQRRQQTAHLRSQRMTPEWISAELARFDADPSLRVPGHDDAPIDPDFEARVRVRYVRALQRILARLRGKSGEAERRGEMHRVEDVFSDLL